MSKYPDNLGSGLTSEQVRTLNDRGTAAAWYAWGRQDAGDGRGVDVFNFRRSYMEQVRDNLTGETTFLPSVQDAWQDFARKVDAS